MEDLTEKTSKKKKDTVMKNAKQVIKAQSRIKKLLADKADLLKQVDKLEDLINRVEDEIHLQQNQIRG